jgi:hypothetical protein
MPEIGLDPSEEIGKKLFGQTHRQMRAPCFSVRTLLGVS